MLPDERDFRRDLERAPFQAGVDRADWRLVAIAWPIATIAVAAAERGSAPTEVALRFNVSGYPGTLPTAAPWDVAADASLPDDLWPRGGRVGIAFNPGWKRDALYIPCDRQALDGHDGWRAAHAAYLWDPSKDITHYLRIVYDLLHSPDYTGVDRET